MSYGSISLQITNYVNHTDKYVPLTGIHSVEEDALGWQWNRRKIPSSSSNRTRFLTYAGGHNVGLLDGTQLHQWQSGVLDGVEYHDICHRRIHDSLTWTPRYSTGSFSVYWDSRTLYSDHSFSTIATYTSDQLRTELILRDDAVHDSVSAKIFKRLSDYQIITVRDSVNVSVFTGELAANVRVDTGTSSDILWDVLETRKNEMLIDGNTLRFNQLQAIVRGFDTDDASIIKSSWQPAGPGLIAGRSLFSTYFPFNTGSVALVSIDASDVVTEWKEVVNLNFSQSSDNHYSVNYDLGTIQTGGFSAPDLVLAAEVSLFDTEIAVVVSDDLDMYPDQGIIIIGDEQIFYLAKTKSSFIDCVRGYNSTVVEVHAKNLIVQDVQHGASTTDSWYFRYVAVPRVEYEVTDYAVRTANYSTWLDVRSLVNVKANNIVQIVSQDTNLASIELTTDRAVIGGNLYGPVFYGTDTSKLIATGLDAAGNPVEDLDLTIQIKSGPGFLNGTLRAYTAGTSSLGQMSSFFHAPYDQDSVDMQVVSVQHIDGNTHMTVNLQTAVVPAEVWVFQILKHDPVLGTIGDAVTAFAGGVAIEPYGFGYIDVWVKYVEDYDNGSIQIVDTSGVRRTLGLRQGVLLKDGNDEPYVRYYVNEAVDPSWFTASTSAWLFQPDAAAWDQAQVRGARVILYEFSTEAQHPITGEAGAYTPVHPDTVTGNVLIFNDRLLPIPSVTDTDTNLGAYIVVAPSETRFNAYGRDPFTGNIIISDDIRLRVSLPNTLSGVDTSGVLPIPYGWTFITDEFNIGAGLDGANFITINPAATGINQFSLTGVI